MTESKTTAVVGFRIRETSFRACVAVDILSALVFIAGMVIAVWTPEGMGCNGWNAPCAEGSPEVTTASRLMGTGIIGGFFGGIATGISACLRDAND